MLSPEIKQKTEMEISLEMEDELRDVQEKLEQVGTNDAKSQELKSKEKLLLKEITARAEKMLKEREEVERLEDGAVRKKLTKHFSNDEEPVRQLESLKSSFGNFMSKAEGSFSLEDQEKMMAEIDACGSIADKELLVDRLMDVIRPIIEFRRNNLRAFELAQRKAFADGSLTGEKFTPVEGTEGIVCYGMDDKRIHLHLAPMRTENPLRVYTEIVPIGMKGVAKVVEDNQQIKLVTATSYVVAAAPKMFTNKIGFTKIGPMKKEFRLQYFGDCDMPVLRAAMTREEFLDKWGQ